MDGFIELANLQKSAVRFTCTISSERYQMLLEMMRSQRQDIRQQLEDIILSAYMELKALESDLDEENA